MCLAIPAKIVEINGCDGVVDLSGVQRKIRLDLLPDAKIGDYVLLHTGFAIETVDEERAKEILDTINEVFGNHAL